MVLAYSLRSCTGQLVGHTYFEVDETNVEILMDLFRLRKPEHSLEPRLSDSALSRLWRRMRLAA